MWSPDWTRLRFRDITAADGYTVTRWRNSASAREAFFNTYTVTPDTHAAFVRSRKPHDLVWMVEEKATSDAVGMLSLTVDVTTATAEYGRAYLDERYRGRGYWIEVEWMMLHFAFDVLALRSVWLDIYQDNEAMCGVHQKYGWREDYAGRRLLNAEAYRHRGDEVLRQRARAGALAYDADLVTETYWKPVLEEVERRLTAPRLVAGPVEVAA